MSAAIRAMVPSADLDDVMQEALVGLVRALPAFRYECSVKHFACRIAVRTASVHNRTRSRRSRADDLGRPPVAEVAHGPDHDARARRRAGLFADLLASLPEPQSEAFALRVVLGYTLQEVAEATGAPANTVRSRVRLAKEALRERIATEPAFAELLEGTS
jgi:RNA polymerase sigma-70 factor (ECF subfamily)